MMKPLRSASAVAACGRIVAVLEPDLFQGEVLIEEFAGGVVVLDRETRAGDAVVLRRLFDQGQCRFDAGVMPR